MDENKPEPVTSVSAFNSIAEYYELLSDSATRLEREGPLLVQWIESAPGSRVVDLACGTGLHAAFLAERGAEVSAFDLSEDMLAHARARRPHANVTYGVGDMRDLRGGPWDLALCLGNSLSLVGSRRDVATVLRSVHAALAPGGVFAVQLLNYASASAQQPRHRVEKRTKEGTELVAVKSLVPHGDRTLLSITFHVLSPDGYRSVSEAATLLNLSCDDMESAAETAGFDLISFLGGFDGAAYDPERSSDLLAVLAERLVRTLSASWCLSMGLGVFPHSCRRTSQELRRSGTGGGVSHGLRRSGRGGVLADRVFGTCFGRDATTRADIPLLCPYA